MCLSRSRRLVCTFRCHLAWLRTPTLATRIPICSQNPKSKKLLGDSNILQCSKLIKGLWMRLMGKHIFLGMQEPECTYTGTFVLVKHGHLYKIRKENKKQD